MRVLAWPRESPSNPIFGVINDSLSERYGTEIEAFTVSKLLSGRFDVWHLQFPETVLFHEQVWKALPRLMMLRALLAYGRLRGMKLLWTANNLGSHERHHPRLERWLWSFFLNSVDAFVTHSEAGASAVRAYHAALRQTPHFVVPEPHFRSLRHDDVDRDGARERLGLPRSARVALFVGRIRPYKCVEHLISVFSTCSGDDLRLIVAGRPHSSDMARRVEQAAGQDRRIELVLEHVPENQLQYYFFACDLVVLPYREIFLSGAALLALSYDRPIVVPRLGALEDLAQEMGPAWVRLYDGTLSAEELSAAMDWAEVPRSGRPDLRRHDLESVGGALQNAYEALVT